MTSRCFLSPWTMERGQGAAAYLFHGHRQGSLPKPVVPGDTVQITCRKFAIVDACGATEGRHSLTALSPPRPNSAPQLSRLKETAPVAGAPTPVGESMNGQPFQSEPSSYPEFGPAPQRPFLTMHLPNLVGGYSRPMHF
jgi:hypothetical protein